jgi:hypothetical protein
MKGPKWGGGVRKYEIKAIDNFSFEEHNRKGGLK